MLLASVGRISDSTTMMEGVNGTVNKTLFELEKIQEEDEMRKSQKF